MFFRLVFLQLRGLGEHPAAGLAFVGLIARVDAHVVVQVPLAVKDTEVLSKGRTTGERNDS